MPAWFEMKWHAEGKEAFGRISSAFLSLLLSPFSPLEATSVVLTLSTAAHGCKSLKRWVKAQSKMEKASGEIAVCFVMRGVGIISISPTGARWSCPLAPCHRTKKDNL